MEDDTKYIRPRDQPIFYAPRAGPNPVREGPNGPYFNINPFECRFRSGTRDRSLSAHRREDTFSSMRATVSDVHGEPTADSRLTVLTSLSRICHLLVKAPSSTLSIEPETFSVCQASQTSKLSWPHTTARSWAFGRRPSDRG